MRVIIATGIYPPDIGGPATYAQFLSDFSEEIGIDPIVVTYGKENRDQDSLRVVSNSWPKGIRHIIYYKKLKDQVKSKSDIIYSVDSSLGVAGIACRAAKAAGAKFVVRVTGDYAWEQGRQRFGVQEDIDEFQTRTYGFIVEKFRSATHRAIRSADWVITPSDYLKRLATDWGVDPNRIKVIPNPVTVYPLSSDSRDKARNGLGVRGKIIISSGRFVPWKGFRELIQIFPNVKNEISDAQLVLIGDGSERASLEKETAKSEARGAIRFTGSLRKSELIGWLSAADLFVLNSSYEGLSHQLIEAVGGFGLPAVVTDAGGNAEVQAEFSDKITLVPVHADRELAKAMVNVLRQNTPPIPPRKRAGKFSPASVTRELHEFFITP